LAQRSIRDAAAERPRPAHEATRSTEHGLNGAGPADRPVDDDPEADETPENEPPIERSDGQVYGG
jgi:hypothetical protein